MNDLRLAAPSAGRRRRNAQTAFAVIAAGLITVSATVSAQPLATGEAVYKAVCSVCHTAGVAGAPKLADKAGWAPLIKEGQAIVTAHGWVGVRGMPARGGSADLSLEGFARATAYMARASGGAWKDPDAAMLARIRAEEVKRIAELKAKK